MDIHIADHVDPIAIYAAIIASVALGWQIFTWLRNGPRLRIRAFPNEVLLGRAHAPDDRLHIVLNVVNVGNAETTLTHMLLICYPSLWHRLLGCCRFG
jgi:hypothetical protein